MITLQLMFDERAGVLYSCEIGCNGKPPVYRSRDLSHEQGEAVLRQMEAILGQQPQAVPAEPMVKMRGFFYQCSSGWFSPQVDEERERPCAITKRDMVCLDLLIPRSAFDRALAQKLSVVTANVQAEAVEAAKVEVQVNG